MSYCEFIEAVQSYQQKVKTIYPDGYRILDPNTFDINTYFGFFDRISVKRGFRIDALYYGSSADGSPYLCGLNAKQNIDYAYELISNNNKRNRETEQEGLETLLTDSNKSEEDKEIDYTKLLFEFIRETNIKQFIVPEDSDYGFFQYLFLLEMGNQFALFWHSYYNRKYIFYSIEPVEELVNRINKSGVYIIQDDDLQRLKQSSLVPDIIKKTDFYQITWFEYRQFKSIYKCVYEIERKEPFDIILVSSVEVLPFKTGSIKIIGL